MFDVNGWEFVILGFLALLVLGPEKLPRYAADAARLVRSVRRMAHNARSEVRDSLGPEFADLNLRDIDPKRLARKHLFDGEEPDFGLKDVREVMDDVKGVNARGVNDRGVNGATAMKPRQPDGADVAPPAPASTPYDPDAT